MLCSGLRPHSTMRCPKCGNLEDKVIDSRAAKAGAAIRRRRECLACQHRFTTYEEIERRDLRVIKRDGRHEPFDRQKLLGGMIKACEKRPVGYDALERAVEEIIQELEQAYDHEVPTNAIGIRVMERLSWVHDVRWPDEERLSAKRPATATRKLGSMTRRAARPRGAAPAKTT